MAQTHSLILMLQVNFEYPEERMQYKKALKNAANLVFKPSVGQSDDTGVKVTGVGVSLPDSPMPIKKWGEM